ncbi:hypothetical protein [Actinomadura sp. NBRC 104425]|uniref:hypothetical protein n=1 Tax=Actinomadura sp. NBRC 104425 TaxID=3032204 RepID=UPI0025573F64|nr:hypothetical protein [Actinomadura sp. NBRC 104425]
MDEPEVWLPLHKEMVESGCSAGNDRLAWAAFVTLVRGKFAPIYSLGEVIRYVAHARSALEDQAHMVNARVAEGLIRRALGDDSLDAEALDMVDDETRACAQILMMLALLADADFDDSALEEFLNSARELAAQGS